MFRGSSDRFAVFSLGNASEGKQERQEERIEREGHLGPLLGANISTGM